MKYKKYGNTILARIDRGEEILSTLKEICLAEKVKTASVNALGAVNDFTVGVFETKTKKYKSNSFSGAFEIVSLTGTVSTMNGEYYSHIHMSAAGADGAVFGGHLNRAVVSATCEMVINVVGGVCERVFDEETGLNIFDF